MNTTFCIYIAKQVVVLSNRLFKCHPVSAWGRGSDTVVGVMAFRFSPKPADNAVQQGDEI